MWRNNGLKFFMFCLFICFVLVWSFICYAGDAKIEVDFTYTQPAKGFTLYLNGTKACSSPTGEVVAFTCNNVPVEYGVNMFTMTATDMDNVETTHSPPFNWVYSPEIGPSPTFLNITVTVDGKNIHLQN